MPFLRRLSDLGYEFKYYFLDMLTGILTFAYKIVVGCGGFVGDDDFKMNVVNPLVLRADLNLELWQEQRNSISMLLMNIYLMLMVPYIVCINMTALIPTVSILRTVHLHVCFYLLQKFSSVGRL